MDRKKGFGPVIALILSTMFMAACGFAAEALATPTSPPSVTPILPTATQVPPTFTAVAASATPTLIPIRADTIYMLADVQSYNLGDVVRSLAFTPDGETLAAGGGNAGDYVIHLWNMANGRTAARLAEHTNIVWRVAFSPDGKLLASVSSDKTAQVWDWRTGTVLKTLDFPGQVVSVSFSPDGQTLAVGGVDESPPGSAAIWTYSVGSWTPLLKYRENTNILALAFSPGGGTLVGGGSSRNVRVWRTSDGARLFTLSHAHQVLTAAISPDGSTLATGTCMKTTNFDCMEGGVWLWDLPTGKLISNKIGGFPSFVTGLAFTADGSSLIAGSRDGTLRVYATSDYSKPLFETAAMGGIEALALSADSGLLATGGSSGGVHVWKIVYRP